MVQQRTGSLPVDLPLQERLRLYALAEETAHIGHWCLAVGSGQLYWSDQVYRIHGLEPRSFKPTVERALEAYHPEDREIVKQHLDQALAVKEGFRFELRLQRPDGEIRRVAAQGFCELDERGEVTALLGIIQDVTERRRAERALGESEQRFRDFADVASDWFWEMDEQLRITYISQRWSQITGLEPSTLLGRTRRELVKDPEAPDVRSHLEDLDARRPFKDFCYEYVDRRGKGHHWQLSGKPVYDARGDFMGYRGTGTDITAEVESRRAEKAAKEQAEFANRAKTDFLANMSHEIRTPLNGVLGMLGLLLDTELNEEQRRYAMVSRNSGEQLLHLINDILDFSKIESGRVELEIASFDPASAVDGVAELLSQQALSKKLDLGAFVAPEIPARLYGDIGRIRQVLINLADNAIKFTDRGGVTLSVTLEGEAEAGSDINLLFEVTDSGPGISPSETDKLFKRFSRLDSSTTRRHGGSGLGLAICRELVELMGGEIGVQSEFGQGSRFWFRIPLRVDPESETASALKLAAPRASQVRILIVEPQPASRRVLKRQLASLGATVALARESGEAEALLSQAEQEGRHFTSVVVSESLPEHERDALVARIGAQGSSGRPFLIYAGQEPGLNAAKARALGFDDYLLKPIRPGSVLDCLLRDVCTPCLPRRRALNAQDSHEIPAASARARVLIAEDNQVNAMLTRTILTQAGHYADCVGNGREVLEALERRPYDIVLMDMQMPILDGLETARQIRRLAIGPTDIPIVALTANAMRSDRDRCYEAGMNDYISKPFYPEDLLAKVAQWAAPPDKAPPPAEPAPEPVTEAAAEADPSDAALDDLLALLDRVEAELAQGEATPR